MPKLVARVFDSIFSNRSVLYICVYVSFEPVIILYTAALLTIVPITWQTILFPSLHILISIVTFGLLAYNLSHIMKVRSHTKYIYSILLVKGIVIFMPYVVYMQADYLFISASAALVSMLFFIIMTCFDTSYEHADF
jgi:hypothetical protein